MGRIKRGRRRKKKRRKKGRLDTGHDRNTLSKNCYIEKSMAQK
jgi:hypothetical protein